MQYVLMLYVNEAGWSEPTPAEQEQGWPPIAQTRRH
jgi:hypothetical protein